MSAEFPDVPRLLERERELRAVDEIVAAATAGSGRGLLLEGPAGIGKTSVLGAAADRAAGAGVAVLRARGDELEAAFPWGMVVQLFGNAVAGPDGDSLLRGAARLARPIFAGAPADAGGNDPFPLLHGLHWLTMNLAERQPLLILLDDVHWSDPESLRFAAYLLRRLDGLPASFLFAARTGEPTPAAAVVDWVRTEPAARSLLLSPLGDESIRRLTRAALPRAADRFCDALAAVVAGNPFMWREAVDAVRAEAIEPTEAAADRLQNLRPAGVRNSILVRLGRLGPDATQLAVAVAVLGPGATTTRAAALAGLADTSAVTATDALVAGGLVALDGGLEFVHPVVREVVYADLGPARRRHAHARAARLLRDDDADVGEVAQHLLMAEPSAEAWRLETLRAAATSARARGAPERAAAFLRAALAGRTTSPERAALLLDLGRAEAAAGERSAAARYEEALDLLPDVVAEPRVALELGQALYSSGRFGEASDAFERGLDGRPADDLLEAQLVAGLDMAGILAPDRPARVRKRLDALVSGVTAPPSLAERVLLALAAARRAMGVDLPAPGPPGSGYRPVAAAEYALRRRDRVLELATTALTGPELPAALGPAVLEAITLALAVCDEFEAARAILDRVLALAGDAGEAGAYATLLPIRGFCEVWSGDLAGAVADAEDALRLADEVPLVSRQTLAPARHVLALASLARGDADVAARAVDVTDGGAQWGGSPLHGWYLDARARVEHARSDHDAALATFLAAGREFAAAGGPGAYCDWRSGAALAAHATGATADAVALAEEELALACDFGAPRAVAGAFRCRARLAGDVADTVDLLEQAVAALVGSGARLERARVLVDLGAALRRRGARRDSRPPLREGMELARQCGARPLAERAVVELEASGARRPRLALTGVESLTPSELRIARLAAGGRSNREIAESLFVTRKTVEVHLSSAYRKLHISSRGELAGALA